MAATGESSVTGEAGAAAVVGADPQRRRVEPPAAGWDPRTALGVVLLAVVLGQAAALAVVAAAGGDEADSLPLAASLLAADAVMLAIVLLAATRGDERVGAATLGLRRTPAGAAIGWALAIWIGALGAFGVAAALAGEGGSDGALALSDERALVVLLVMVGVGITAPIVEEIGFRGYLFAALTRWRGPWPAAVTCGVLFGAAHFASAPPQFLPPLALLGFGLCLLFWITGSLLPCIGLHALNNGLVVSIAAGWTWAVPLGALGAAVVALLLTAPFSARRAPQHA